VLTQRQRKILSQLRNRHGRRKSEFFAAEGLRACTEAVARRPEWFEFAMGSRSFLEGDAGRDLAARLQALASGAGLVRLDDQDFAALAATENPQGVLCVLRRPDMGLPDAVMDPFVLVLDQVREPGNLGTILRTAWAVGLRSV
jgi:TrmH family RNA methyltransferase